MHLSLFAGMTIAAGAACADEGMWMPSQLPEIAAQLMPPVSKVILPILPTSPDRR